MQPDGSIREGFWRSCESTSLLEGLSVTSRSVNNAALEIRDKLSRYFVTNGSVSWQYDHIHQR